MKLSICIATYNRALELKNLLHSISSEFLLEVVICDDGSTDDTLGVVDEFKKSLTINYFYQKNQGRSIAIVEAIMMSKGDYIVIMDSDDIFVLDGLMTIFNTIENNINEKSFVFGVLIKKNESYIENLPPAVIGVNLISLRADYKVKGDLKEVTQRDVLLSCIHPNYDKYKRVPTSWIWSCVAEETDSIVLSKSVIVKDYLPGGMTKNIRLLKSLYPEPLVDLYGLLFKSKKYRSKIYRWRSIFLLVRYSFHARSLKFNHLAIVIVFIPALFIFIYDVLILTLNKIRIRSL